MLPMSERPTLVKTDWKRLGLFKGSRAELETSGLLGAIYPVLWGDPGKSHPHAIGSQCKDWGTSCQLRAFVWAFKAFMSCLRQPLLCDSRESCLESYIPIAWNEVFWHILFQMRKRSQSFSSVSGNSCEMQSETWDWSYRSRPFSFSLNTRWSDTKTSN